MSSRDLIFGGEQKKNSRALEAYDVYTIQKTQCFNNRRKLNHFFQRERLKRKKTVMLNK